MKTEFTVSEKEVIEVMRNKLAKRFGVTVIDDIVTLRFGDIDSKVLSVTMKIVEVDDDSTEECFLCQELFPKGSLDTVEMIIEKEKRIIRICSDCHCSK